MEHHSSQIEKEISQDLINYNLKEMNESVGDTTANAIIAHLKEELEEKYETIQILKKDNEMKDKSIQFAMQNFLRSEQEKLRMEQHNYNLEDSTEEEYYHNE